VAQISTNDGSLAEVGPMFGSQYKSRDVRQRRRAFICADEVLWLPLGIAQTLAPGQVAG
jgi:hypothetical protein